MVFHWAWMELEHPNGWVGCLFHSHARQRAWPCRTERELKHVRWPGSPGPARPACRPAFSSVQPNLPAPPLPRSRRPSGSARVYVRSFLTAQHCRVSATSLLLLLAGRLSVRPTAAPPAAAIDGRVCHRRTASPPPAAVEVLAATPAAVARRAASAMRQVSSLATARAEGRAEGLASQQLLISLRRRGGHLSQQRRRVGGGGGSSGGG